MIICYKLIVKSLVKINLRASYEFRGHHLKPESYNA